MDTIIKLPERTIQMIAAGEVITRPVNVVKELLENSLDAGATNIRITIDHGGSKLIEIIDNGHGIARKNAVMLCHRYATSKLNIADDLTRISTFGFRGEALASISEVADIEVKSFNMIADKTGWQAKYKHGQLCSPPEDKFLQNVGTQIKITNLFTDYQLRKKSIQSSFIDEKRYIVDLITRYALHHRDKVTMSLKEFGSIDLVCLLAPVESKPCVGMFFGLEMERNCIEKTITNSENFIMDARLLFSYKKLSGSHQQTIFILFVNNRLVDCNQLKREIETAASQFLNTKNYVSFFYLALNVPPHDLDVNTHPSKATVALHYHTEIVSCIVDSLKTELSESLVVQSVIPNPTPQKIVSQLLQTQIEKSKVTLSPEATDRIRIMAPGSLENVNLPSIPKASPSVAKRSHDLVHNDFTQKTLDIKIPPRRVRRDLRLKSINDLRQLVSKERAKGSSHTIKKSVFVGIFDHDYALIQCETTLYAINLKAYLTEQYYQFYLYDFGNFPTIDILPPGNKVKTFIETYLIDIEKHEAGVFKKLKYNTFDSVIDRLLEKSEMFADYMSIKFTRDEILTLPCILPDEAPNLVFLGKFFVDLANNVDYDDERLCFLNIGRTIADFYSNPPANLKNIEVHKKYHDLVDSTLHHALKNYLIIPEWLFNKANMCEVGDTKKLYRVFERC